MTEYITIHHDTLRIQRNTLQEHPPLNLRATPPYPCGLGEDGLRGRCLSVGGGATGGGRGSPRAIQQHYCLQHYYYYYGALPRYLPGTIDSIDTWFRYYSYVAVPGTVSTGTCTWYE